MLKSVHCLFLCAVMFFTAVASAAAQSRSDPAKEAPSGKAAAYYHFALGHLYAELAGAYGNKGDLLDKAIDNYREALRVDPEATFLADELSDLYVQAGRLREAVEEAKAALDRNPNDLNSRRILGRIYTRLLGDPRQGSVNEEMVQRAIEQFQKLSEAAPNDVETWLTLGRLHKLAHNSNESEAAYKKVLEIDADHEEALIGLAMVYSDLGDQPRSAEMLRRVVAKHPSARTLTALGRTYEQQKEYAQAAEIFKQALGLSPDNSSLKYSLAENLLLSDQVDDAVKVYRELSQEDQKDYRPPLRLSQVYRTQGKFADARKELEKAREAAPDNLEVRYHEVNLLESEGKADEAIGVLKNILDSTRKDAYSSGERSNRAVFLERLGLMYRSNDQFEEAVATFRELQNLDAEFELRALAQVSDTHRQEKEFRKALEVIDEAYKKDPDNRMVAMVRATVLADLGRSDEAVDAVRALLKDNKDLESYLTLAQIYEKTKRFRDMGASLEHALPFAKTDEDKANVLFMKGAMHERMKNFDEAEASFREVLRLTPDNTSAMNYLGYMFADRNVRLEEALKLITKALETEPNNGAYLDSLGWVYYRLGRLEEAEENLKRAAQKVSRDPVVHDHLGDVYFRQGKLKEAIAHWRVSLKEWESSSAGEKDPSQVASVQKKLESAEVRLAKESATEGAKNP
ncbi:MAG: tetratricopeptide repeat protein [Bryobacteraceae bacterium]|nr:tetratricopeptide repeat protein [Bryobacteraceae bacterium]